jgi:hypothetical protein
MRLPPMAQQLVARAAMPFIGASTKSIARHKAAINFSTKLALKPAEFNELGQLTRVDGKQRLAHYLSRKTGIPVVEIGNATPKQMGLTAGAMLEPMTKQGQKAKAGLLGKYNLQGWLISHGSRKVRTLPDGRTMDTWMAKLDTPQGTSRVDVGQWGSYRYLQQNAPHLLDSYGTHQAAEIAHGRSIFNRGDKILFTVCDDRYKASVRLPLQTSKLHTVGTPYFVTHRRADKVFNDANTREWFLSQFFKRRPDGRLRDRVG